MWPETKSLSSSHRHSPHQLVELTTESGWCLLLCMLDRADGLRVRPFVVAHSLALQWHGSEKARMNERRFLSDLWYHSRALYHSYYEERWQLVAVAVLFHFIYLRSTAFVRFCWRSQVHSEWWDKRANNMIIRRYIHSIETGLSSSGILKRSKICPEIDISFSIFPFNFLIYARALVILILVLFYVVNQRDIY